MISAGQKQTTYADFLRGLVKNPKAVSAPTPSSPALARAIAGEVDVNRPGFVIELGPGTGVVTRALLDRGIVADRICAIEQETEYVALLRQRFPLINVHRGNAFQFERYLGPNIKVAAIVSGLPLLHHPIHARQSLLTRALACQSTGGCFIQLSYSWNPPIAGLPEAQVSKKIIWQNLPPAHVWSYRKLS